MRFDVGTLTFHISRFTSVLLLAAVLAACETVVDVTPPSHDPQLVAQGFFTPDSLWAIRVTHTVPFASSETPGFVDDATVNIWEGDRLVAQPARTDSGTYVVSGQGAAMDRTYTLRVAAPGYPPTEGSDVLPSPPPVAAFQETPVQREDSTSRRRITQVDVTLTDPPDADNYYGLLVIQARWQEDRQTGQLTPLPPSLFPFQSSDLALGESEFDFLDTEKTLYREAFFTDGLFDGSTYTLDVEIQYDAPHPDADVVIQRAFAVVVLSVSDDFFRYWTTAGQQVFTNENPFAEPLRVHSNMTNGHGVFAGFQYRIFPLSTGSLDPSTALDSLCSLVGGRLPVCPAAAILAVP